MSYLDDLSDIFSDRNAGPDGQAETCGGETALDAARRQFDASSRYFFEGPEGTFRACGNRHGCGYAQVVVTVDPATGLAHVDVDANLHLDPDKVKPARKLFRRLNAGFIVPGLMVDDEGWVHFRPEQDFDVLGDDDLVDIVSKGLSTIHAHANMVAQLQAGRAAWDVLQADEEQDRKAAARRRFEEADEDESDSPAGDEGMLDALRHLIG